MSDAGIYLIDTRMFGYERFNAAYLVKREELVLIDTGPSSSTEVVRAAIGAHGFAIGDIARIFITHEHNDHSGNAGYLLKENTRARVYAHPADAEHLVYPERERAWMKSTKMKPEMLARFGTMEPVPEERLTLFEDGDVFDLGGGERLRVIFTPGHQPSGVVLYLEKSRGLFINDLVGLNLADAGAAWIFTPPKSDVRRAMASLRQLMELPVSRLYLGHFGIREDPGAVMQGALERMQRLMDIGAACVARGEPEAIEKEVLAILEREVAKIGAARGTEGLYRYVKGELVPHLGAGFASYYLSLAAGK